MTTLHTTWQLMLQEETFMQRPLAYAHRDRLIIRVRTLCPTARPETILRAQRALWQQLAIHNGIVPLHLYHAVILPTTTPPFHQRKDYIVGQTNSPSTAILPQ